MTRKAPGRRRGRKPTGSRGTTTLDSDTARRILASPLRQEILQAFAQEPSLTVRELGARLGKSRGALYYHVRELLTAGVLVEAERVLVGRRYESHYSLAAERLAVAADASSDAARDSTLKLVWSTLRQAGREFESALESGRLEEHEGLEVGQRMRAWLTDRDLERVQTHLRRIHEICARAAARERGTLYSFTSLVVPLEPDSE